MHLISLANWKRKGDISADERPRIWQDVSGSGQLKEKNPEAYNILAKTPSECEPQILLDIPRTHSQVPYFKNNPQSQKKLFNVLRAHSIYGGRYGYCQGINYIAGVLVSVFANEEDAFWLLVQLMKKYQLEELFAPGLPGLIKHLRKLDELIKDYCPLFEAKMKTEDISSKAFASKWILTLFSCRCNWTSTIQIFDWFLFDGWDAIYLTALVFIKHLQDLMPMAPVYELLSEFETLPQKFSAAELSAAVVSASIQLAVLHSTPNLATPVKTGWLIKRGGYFTRYWKRRWCVLTPSVLYYFDTQQSDSPRGFLELEGCLIGPYSDAETDKEVSESEKMGENGTSNDHASQNGGVAVFGFAVFHPLKRTFIFYTRVEQERTDWLEALTSRMSELASHRDKKSELSLSARTALLQLSKSTSSTSSPSSSSPSSASLVPSNKVTENGLGGGIGGNNLSIPPSPYESPRVSPSPSLLASSSKDLLSKSTASLLPPGALQSSSSRSTLRASLPSTPSRPTLTSSVSAPIPSPHRALDDSSSRSRSLWDRLTDAIGSSPALINIPQTPELHKQQQLPPE